MANKKIILALLGIATAAFLTSGCVDSNKMKQLENEVSQLNQAILQKDAKIKILTGQAQAKQKDFDTIKKELDNSKKGLDNVKKELDSAKKELDSVNKKLNALVAKPETIKK